VQIEPRVRRAIFLGFGGGGRLLHDARARRESRQSSGLTRRLTREMAEPMNKRLAMLEKLTSSAQADSFAFYCLAMEYRKEGRVDDAVGTFSTLRDRDAGYLPMYLMAGQVLREAARLADASQWLKQGIELARQKNDGKALGELESELATVES
jgi:predicted Zn-dependent protease